MFRGRNKTNNINNSISLPTLDVPFLTWVGEGGGAFNLYIVLGTLSEVLPQTNVTHIPHAALCL